MSDEELEVCSDAPHWDLDFFCDLVYADHQSGLVQVMNQTIKLTTLFNQVNAEALEQQGVIRLNEKPMTFCVQRMLKQAPSEAAGLPD
ncbi:hypothetical protein [Pseudomonas brassicacearum]|uniref:hypothetical protein n=1 Tax=Pseudomonas brassicacearum TaxID=930166 RepID=UPI000F46A212|nr:hypothetical protein [Pseudomonas brassicacearum]